MSKPNWNEIDDVRVNATTTDSTLLARDEKLAQVEIGVLSVIFILAVSR